MESVLNIRQILEVMPHRYPFLLIDKVISQSIKADGDRVGQKVVALKNVTFNEPFFAGHFPGLPVMPGVLQIEAMAQAACLAFLRPNDPPMDIFVATIENAKFRRLVVPGDTLMLHAEIIKDRRQMLLVRTEAKVEGNTVAEAEILAKVMLRSERERK